MKIFLLRHGHPDYYGSKSRNDPELSSSGAKAIHELGDKAKERLSCVTKLIASPMLRTQETARIIQEYLAPSISFETLKILAPDSNISILINWLEETVKQGPLLLVGHHPELYALTHYLIPSGSLQPIFNRGTLVEFEFTTQPLEGACQVVWSDT